MKHQIHLTDEVGTLNPNCPDCQVMTGKFETVEVKTDSGNSWYFEESVGRTYHVCGRCGAIIHNDYVTIHAEWHDQKGL